MLNSFIYILLHNVIPLIAVISIGIFLYRAFHLDIKTLSKLNFYLFAPVIIFKMIYESDITGSVFLQVLLFFVLFFLALIAVVELFIRLKRYSPEMRTAMRNSVIFYNSANYGIPINQLVFLGNPFAMSIQVIILMMMDLIPNTFGVYSVSTHKGSLRNTVKIIFSLPGIYAIPLAFFLRWAQIPIPEPLYIPLNYVANGFIGMALITLGVQLGSMKWVIRFSDVLISNAFRLLIGPVFGYLIVLLLGIEGLMAQALVLSCAVPTSLVSVLLAVEFDNEPEFASQAVFSSTLLSVFTVTLVIYMLRFIG